jgi:hypothetical protein
VCSIDKAEQIGLNWWRHDTRLTAGPVAGSALPAGELETRLDRIERRLDEMAANRPGVGGRKTPSASE